MPKEKQTRLSGPRVEVTITYSDRSKIKLAEKGVPEVSILNLIPRLCDLIIESRVERMRLIEEAFGIEAAREES